MESYAHLRVLWGVLLSLALLSTVIHAFYRLRYFLHIFQLEGYKIQEFWRWLVTRGRKISITPAHGISLLLLGLLILWPALSPAVFLLWTGVFLYIRPYKPRTVKKPLVWTPRMRRLATWVGIVLLLLSGSGLWAGFYWMQFHPLRSAVIFLLTAWLIDAGIPLWLTLGAWLASPIERLIQWRFKQQARKKLQQRPDLTIVGITGSYGKTSTKFIIAELLKQRFHVLPTPGSYNTPMGLCLVINNQLRPEHNVLILEMGARYPGDIQELCQLAQPDIGVVTTVGKAHLESMGSIEAIAREKSTLIRCLKPTGTAVLNIDNPYVADMAAQAPGKVLTVSASGNPADLKATHIQYGPQGTTFEVEDATGHKQTFHTRLLGKHNVLNILLGLAVGQHMGLRLRQMAQAVARLQPIEHRLQLRQEGPITIIDDAFNSNPIGARNAVEILGQFTQGQRIIVTPGMIELGPLQAKENYDWGVFMAPYIDLAILIGSEQTRPIAEGLKEAGFPEAQIKVFNTLHDAQTFLKEYLQPGDTVLYENDLPDQYHEIS